MAGFLIQKINTSYRIIIEESLIETFVDDLAPYAKFYGVTFEQEDKSVLGHINKNLNRTGTEISYLVNKNFFLELEIAETESPIANKISLNDWQIANKLALNHSFSLDNVGLYRPLELNYDKLRVSFDKGCFRGQEIIARMHYLGVNRRSFCTIIEDGGYPSEFNIEAIGNTLFYENYKIYNCFIKDDIKNEVLSSENHQLISNPTSQ